MLGKIQHKREIRLAETYENKLQNPYQKVKVLETSMFGHISFE